MAAAAGVGAAHPAVAGEEGAAAAQREAVAGVVAEEGGGPAHHGHAPAPARPVLHTPQLLQVRHARPRRAPHPLQRAVALQRVGRQQEHRPTRGCKYFW